MKTKHFYKTGILAALPIGCVAGFGILTAQAEEGKLDYSGTASLGVGGADVSGNKAAFQRRVGQNGDFYGGLSDFHVQTEKGDVLYTLDGHAVFGNTDYEFILGAVKEGAGYIEVGYSEFRTWYDGSGGYRPGWTTPFYTSPDDDLHLDRGEFWVETGLRLEDQPEYTFRYTHAWRDGQKDSTMWGRPNNQGNRPNINNIDETRDIFEFDITHTLGNTELGLGLRYETDDNSDTRNTDNGSGAIINHDAYEADLFNAHTYSVSRLNDQMMLSFGYAFTTVNTDTDGSYRTVDHVFGDAIGGAESKAHVVNANFWWNPTQYLVLVPSIRAEHQNQSATMFEGSSDERFSSDTDYDSMTEQLDIRYTGCENILLYSRIEATQANGGTNYWEYASAVLDASKLKSVDSTFEKYTAGATWYPLRKLSLTAEYYHKNYDSDYTNDLDGMDAQLASHDSSTDDVNFRVTWKALPNLTLVTRYDWQDASYKSMGIDSANNVLPEVQSGDFERNIISQSITYLPLVDLYMMGSVSYTWSETSTPTSTGLPTILMPSDNDYLTVDFTVGYALDEKTSITAGYAYYYANNYAFPSASINYGADLEEHVFSAGLTRQLSENMLMNVGYAYYTSDDGTSGGYNNFDAHMLSSGLQVKF